VLSPGVGRLLSEESAEYTMSLLNLTSSSQSVNNNNLVHYLQLLQSLGDACSPKTWHVAIKIIN